MKLRFAIIGAAALVVFGCGNGSDPSKVATEATTSSTDQSTPSAVIKTGNPPSAAGQTTEKGSAPTSPDNVIAGTSEPPKTTQIPAKPSQTTGVGALTDNYGPSNMSLDEVVQQTDRTLAFLANTTAKVDINFQDKYGKGFCKCVDSIKDANNFRIEYPQFGDQKNRVMRAAWVADGKKYVITNVKKTDAPKPLGGVPVAGQVSLGKWSEQCSLRLFEALQGAHPLADLVKEAKDPANHATVSIDQIRFDFKGHVFTHRRIKIDAAKPGQPKTSIVVMIDGDHSLPISIGVKAYKSPKDTSDFLWEAAYDLRPTQIIDPHTFDFPGPTKVSKG